MPRAALIACTAPPPHLPGRLDGRGRARAVASAAAMLELAGVDLLVLDEPPFDAPSTTASADPEIIAEIGALGIDPAILVPMLGDATRSLAVAPAISTGLYPPYMAARLLSTLDTQTAGRAAINITVSSEVGAGAGGMGIDADVADGAYEKAADFLGACSALWSSWHPESLVLDTNSGVFADPSRVVMPHYSGPFFKSRGPLNTIPSPQGRPPVVHIAADKAGGSFAAAHADVVIVNGNSLAELEENWASFRDAAAERPVIALVGVRPFTALTDSGAKALRAAAGPKPGVLDVVGALSDVLDQVLELMLRFDADGISLASSLDLAAVGSLCARFVPALRSAGAEALPSHRTFQARLAELSR